jgi:hypothetical protein
LFKHIHAAHAGHQLIQQDNVKRGSGVPDPLQTLIAAFSADDTMPGICEHSATNGSHVPVVVNNEYSGHKKKRHAFHRFHRLENPWNP